MGLLFHSDVGRELLFCVRLILWSSVDPFPSVGDRGKGRWDGQEGKWTVCHKAYQEQETRLSDLYSHD